MDSADQPIVLKPALSTEDFVHEMERRIKHARADLAKFRDGFDKDPFYAMDWSKRAFEAAANAQVFTRMVRIMQEPDSKATVSSLMQFAHDEIVRRAANPQLSTSPVSNFAALCETAAWVEVYRVLSGNMF